MVRLRVSQGFNGNAGSKQRVRILEPLPGAKVLNGLKNIRSFCFVVFSNPKAKHTDADGSATGRDKKVESCHVDGAHDS